MYKLTNYTKMKAKKLGVEVRLSSVGNKKVDVYKNGMKVASIGDKRYADYPTYMISHGKHYADNRRRLYRLRHAKEESKIGTPGYYAFHLLW